MREKLSSTRRNIEPPDARALGDKGRALAAADAAATISTYFSIRAEEEGHLTEDVVDVGPSHRAFFEGFTHNENTIWRLARQCTMNLEPAIGDMTGVASGTHEDDNSRDVRYEVLLPDGRSMPLSVLPVLRRVGTLASASFAALLRLLFRLRLSSFVVS